MVYVWRRPNECASLVRDDAFGRLGTDHGSPGTASDSGGAVQPTICLGRLSLIERTVRLLAILPSLRKDKTAGVDQVGLPS